MYTSVKEANPAVRILVVRLGAMGDIIHTLPAVASLKHSLPGSHITWAIAPKWAPLLEGNVFVDRRILVELGGRLSLRFGVRAGAGNAHSDRHPGIYHQPVFVADAVLREKHLRRRAEDAWIPAFGRWCRRAGKHAFSGEPFDYPWSRTGDRHRRPRVPEPSWRPRSA